MHCRCMNIGGQCPNMHPSECVEHCPELVAQKAHTKPSPQMGWREDYEIENVHFLVYDKASGSRWLDHDRLKSFISTVEARARKEVAEEILADIPENRDIKKAKRESGIQYAYLVERVVGYNIALNKIRTIINKYINE